MTQMPSSDVLAFEVSVANFTALVESEGSHVNLVYVSVRAENARMTTVKRL